jgi:hypothetical protein
MRDKLSQIVLLRKSKNNDQEIAMGATTEAQLEQMDKDAKEVVAECDNCGGGVSNEQLHSMPFEGGVPVWILCETCVEKSEA